MHVNYLINRIYHNLLTQKKRSKGFALIYTDYYNYPISVDASILYIIFNINNIFFVNSFNALCCCRHLQSFSRFIAMKLRNDIIYICKISRSNHTESSDDHGMGWCPNCHSICLHFGAFCRNYFNSNDWIAAFLCDQFGLMFIHFEDNWRSWLLLLFFFCSVCFSSKTYFRAHIMVVSQMFSPTLWHAATSLWRVTD